MYMYHVCMSVFTARAPLECDRSMPISRNDAKTRLLRTNPAA
jgi:hypothetical protein